MKIAYIFIATGKYELFINGLTQSGKKNFFPEHETEFYIFTDSTLKKSDDSVKIIHQEKMGWPYDTLKRFHLINSIKDKLTHDYIFFGNANMFFNEKIGIEILPNDDENGLIGSIHPNFYQTTHNRNFPYERNNYSKAYVPYGQEGKHYYQGCFFGGRREPFLKMSEVLEKNIQTDLDNNFIAVWHDESHMNRYFIDNIPKALDSGYVYPPSYNLPFSKKILQLGKQEYGGLNYLRN